MYPGDDVDSLVRQSTAVTLVAGACMTTLLYHHFITLEKEITRMWTGGDAHLRIISNDMASVTRVLATSAAASRTFRPAPNNNGEHGSRARNSRPPNMGAVSEKSRGVATLIGLTIVDYVKEDVIIDQSLESLPGCYAKTVPEVIAGFCYCVFRWGPPFLSSLLVTPSTTAGCILGSHLLLNLRNRIQAVDNQVEAASTNIPLKIRRPVRSDTDYEEDSDHDGDEEITQKTDRGRGKDVELTMNPNRVLPTSTNDGISPSVPGFTASKCHDN
ncbi:hypothetical protein D9756_009886 [Leucocoprinus leucothites]|uniref:Uncharacterized protein n=1 Tax=Leucocoprinus leucothites TaxID=201217 RepID=A0A8H5CVC4_9AGAR|nr:hypothetical protein D9756_009886 [Leucoagaricus leucothites]